jgi:peptide/nickel transport system substrate-binding protein
MRLGTGNEISAVELAHSPVYAERPEAQGRYRLSSLSFPLYPNAEAAIAAYASREVNALANIAARERLLVLPSSRVYTQVDSSAAMLIFNWKETPLAEKRLRQSLSLSLDVPELVQKHLGADVAYADSPYPPSSSIYLTQPFWRSYDIAHARTLLDAAGIFPSNEDEAPATEANSASDVSTSKSLSLLIEDTAPMRNLAHDIAAQWGLLGFQLQTEALSIDDLSNRLETGRFQTAILMLPIGGDFDLYRYWHPAQYGNGQNYGAASDHDIADLLEKARREIYSNRRAALYQQFQIAFAEQAVAIPLYYPLYTFVLNEQIDGLQLGYLASPADRFRGIGEWRITTPTS